MLVFLRYSLPVFPQVLSAVCREATYEDGLVVTASHQAAMRNTQAPDIVCVAVKPPVRS